MLAMTLMCAHQHQPQAKSCNLDFHKPPCDWWMRGHCHAQLCDWPLPVPPQTLPDACRRKGRGTGDEGIFSYLEKFEE